VHARPIVVALLALVLLAVRPARGQDASVTPAVPMRSLLGRTRAQIDAQTGVRGTNETSGWVRYGPTLLVRFEHDVATRLIAHVPSGLDCAQAARWMGYPDATPSLRSASSCEWPGISDRHVLAVGHAGSLDLRTGSFEIRLRSRD
jgi:hypothetical protein